MELVLALLVPMFFPLLALAFFGYGIVWGFVRRGRLQAQLAEEEPRLAHLVRTNIEDVAHDGPVSLVMGNVAYGADAPSRWASTWRNIFGGRADSLTMQADMARRLATVRMLHQAQRMGAVAVTNVRYETSEIFSGRGEQAMLVIEMLAYGNALVPAAHAVPPRDAAPPPPRG
jgi:uncharacterized protein YbjQ (UPF0145 family)